jgi:hypothetical protein
MAEVKVRVTAENATRTGFQQALGEAKRFGNDASGGILSSFQNIGGALKATFAGVFAGIGIGSLVRNTISELSNIGNLAQQFGVSAESLQRIGQVASESGVSIDQVGAAMGRLVRSVQAAQGGTGKQADAFRDLGLSVKELAGLTPEQQFLRLADAVASAADRQKAYSATVDVAGRSAGNLIPILQQGSAALKEQFDTIGVVSDETVAKIKQVEDSFSRLGKQITVGLGPAIAFVGKFALAGTEAFKFVATEAKNLVVDLAKAAGAAASLDFSRVGEIFSEGDATSLRNLEEFEKRVSDIYANTAQESVRLALEATGLDNATELQKAIDELDDKTIDVAVKASGLKSVEELEAAIKRASRGPAALGLDEITNTSSREADAAARAEENARRAREAARQQAATTSRAIADFGADPATLLARAQERLSALQNPAIAANLGLSPEQTLAEVRALELEILNLKKQQTAEIEKQAQEAKRAAQSLATEIEQRDFAALSPADQKAKIAADTAALIAGAESGAISPAEAAQRALELQRREDALAGGAGGFAGDFGASALQRVGGASEEFFRVRPEENREQKRGNDILQKILTALEKGETLVLKGSS